MLDSGAPPTRPSIQRSDRHQTLAAASLHAFAALVALATCGCLRPIVPSVDASRPSFVSVSVPSSGGGDAHDLLVGVTEVTRGQWRDVMGTEPYGSDCDDCPVRMVSWYDAAAFANALSQREGLSACYQLSDCSEAPPYQRSAPGRAYSHETGLYCATVESVGPSCSGYRLPNRAEWDAYGGVSALHQSRRRAHRYANAAGPTPRRVTVVATRLPNEHGIYDTLGNVEEWLDVEVPPFDEVHRFRRHLTQQRWFLAAGTCFRSDLRDLRPNYFVRDAGSWGRDCHGFRVVRTAPPAS
ncbi:MAG: SUMF1/EgtB/PvdO family nonheme iron enzyme [Polyangiales bacterium]